MPGEQEISWTVSATHHERSNDWYWGLGVLAFGGVVVSIFFDNILLGIIIGLSAISIGILASREPREHSFKIDARGIVLDGTRYPYSAIHSFWVEHEVSQPYLFLTMNGLMASHLSFELQDEARGAEVRTFLKRFVEEEEQGPHVGEHLAQILRL